MEEESGESKGAPEWRQVLEETAGGVGVPGRLGVYLESPMHLSPPPPPGRSTWQRSLTSVVCATQPPARRSWQWPGTWNSVRWQPCPHLGTVPSSQTSPCPGHLSASVFLSSWAASSPRWPACPGLGLRLLLHYGGPRPDAETLPTLPRCPHLCCWQTIPPSTDPNSQPGTTDPWAGKNLSGLLPSPQTPCSEEEKPARRSKEFPRPFPAPPPQPSVGWVAFWKAVHKYPRPPLSPHLKVWPQSNVLRNVRYLE